MEPKPLSHFAGRLMDHFFRVINHCKIHNEPLTVENNAFVKLAFYKTDIASSFPSEKFMTRFWEELPTILKIKDAQENYKLLVEDFLKKEYPTFGTEQILPASAFQWRVEEWEVEERLGAKFYYKTFVSEEAKNLVWYFKSEEFQKHYFETNN